MVDYNTGTSTVWNGWTTASSSTTTASSNTWVLWTDGTWGNETGNHGHVQSAPTEEEIRVAQAVAQEKLRKKQEAELKADELLLSLLDQRQRKEYKETQKISIYQGRKPKWVLHKRPSYNVVELDDCGHPIKEHCVQTLGVPLADQLATQYLYLHTNPDELLRVANHQILR